MKGKNGQQKAKENVLALETWIEQRNAKRDWGEYEYNGKTNRTVLAEELGFAKSVFSQNKRVKELLLSADEIWFKEKKLEKQAHEDARERSEQRATKISASNNTLVRRNAELEAENRDLKAKIAKFDNLQSLIQSGSPGFKL